MKWGIVVNWDERGLTCCGWMQRTDEDTVDDAMEFASAADAAFFISQIDGKVYPGQLFATASTPFPYDRILMPHEFAS